MTCTEGPVYLLTNPSSLGYHQVHQAPHSHTLLSHHARLCHLATSFVWPTLSVATLPFLFSPPPTICVLGGRTGHHH